jgi:DNA-binding transcriptional ArsR family regulator
MVADIDSGLDALGDPMRRAIVGRLAAGPLDVGRISAGMPIGRSAVSMHLRVLKAAGLVADRAAGNRRVYQLEPDALRRLRDHLDWYWERSLAAYQQAAQEQAAQDQAAQQRAKEQAVPEIVVAKTVRVAAPLAIAFDVFAGQRWWPVDTHHLTGTPGSEVVLEPFAGGRWSERAPDGTRTDWGTVLAWQPPWRLLLTWQVSPQWTYERDPGLGSEIEVTFTPEGPDVTRVDLTHRHLERYGSEAERMRRILEGNGGEPLAAFVRHIAARGPSQPAGAGPAIPSA